MKITHYSNSFISVDAEGHRMVCDPWVGKANASGWQSFPEFSCSALTTHLADVRWVYLSHLHDDHFHPETLKSCGLLDREFIIKRFQSPILRDRLKRLGVTKIHEVEPFSVNRFGPFQVTVFPQMTSNSSALEDDVNYDLDTSIAIKADGIVFFNQVDNPLSLNDLERIRDHVAQHLGTIDVSCIMSGAASEYPHLFLGIDHVSEKLRIVERSLKDLGEWLRMLQPKYYFPAGGTYLIPGWLSVHNENIAQPNFSEIENYLAQSQVPVRPISLEGGHCLELSAKSPEIRLGVEHPPLVFDRQAAINRHRDDSYLYETLTPPSWPEIENLLKDAGENWRKKVQHDGLKISQSISFAIYSKLGLLGDRPDASVGVHHYQLFISPDSDAGELIVHIDQRAIYGCITRKLVWNGVLGSLCLYERMPNRHYPTDFFSLNFLALSQEQLVSLHQAIQ